MEKYTLVLCLLFMQIGAMDYYIEDESFSSEMEYWCSFCNTVCSTSKVLTSHMRRQHKNDLEVFCGVCESKYITSRALLVHFLKEHVKNVYSCCDQIFDYSALLIHINKTHRIDHYNTIINMYDTDISEFYTCSPIQETTDIESAIADCDSKIVCSVCEKKYTSQEYFFSHFYYKHVKMGYNCCANYFDLSPLKLHINEKHKIVQFKAKINDDTDRAELCYGSDMQETILDEEFIEIDEIPHSKEMHCDVISTGQVLHYCPQLEKVLESNTCWDYEIWRQCNQ